MVRWFGGSVVRLRRMRHDKDGWCGVKPRSVLGQDEQLHTPSMSGQLLCPAKPLTCEAVSAKAAQPAPHTPCGPPGLHLADAPVNEMEAASAALDKEAGLTLMEHCCCSMRLAWAPGRATAKSRKMEWCISSSW